MVPYRILWIDGISHIKLLGRG